MRASSFFSLKREYSELSLQRCDSYESQYQRIPRYSTQKDFESHMQTEYCQEFMRTLEKEGVMAKPTFFKFVTPAAGFASR